MQHILHTTDEEIKQNILFLSSLRESSGWFSLFSYGFNHFYNKYESQKENILMFYSSVYSDIKKDVSDTQISASDTEDIRKSLIYITKWIRNCSRTLKYLKFFLRRDNVIENDIYHYEINFIKKLFENFSLDLSTWMEIHSHEIAWEIQKLSRVWDTAYFDEWKWLIELQKKRLEWHRNNINNT